MPKKIGLALGGGFVLGAAHIGVLKVLEKNDIKPQMIAGTSAGSIVASLYAYGWNVSELERLVRNLKARMFIDEFVAVENFFVMTVKLLFDVLHLPCPFRSPLGLMRGIKLEQFIKSKLGQKKFDKTVKQLAVTSVDIASGKKVIFLSQQDKMRLAAQNDQIFISGVPIWKAVRASTAVPGVYEPQKINGYLLSDGGLRENVPAQVLKALGADVVIAVDLGIGGEKPTIPRNIIELLGQTLDIIRADSLEHVLEGNTDVLIRPDLQGIGSWDFHRIPYIIEQGEKATSKLLPDIFKLCARR